MSEPGTEGNAEALRIFLRLTRPRPLADPYPLHARLRDLAPFLPIRFPGVANGFLVSTFAGCSRLLRDPAFGPPTGEHLDALRPGWRENAFTRSLYRSMPLLTGQSHRAQRQAASHHFSPRSMEAYRDEMERVATTLLDDLAGLAPTVDLMDGLALPFASLSLGRLLGIADDEAIRLGRLTRQASGAFEQFATARQHARTAAAGAELVDRLTVIVAGQGGANDLLASLAGSGGRGRAGARRLRGDVVRRRSRLACQHGGPGHEAPSRPSGPGEPAARAARPGAARGGRDPPLRAAGAARGPGRVEPAELEGRRVPPGSMVFGLIAAGNRDPAQVKEAEAFDVTRSRSPRSASGPGRTTAWALPSRACRARSCSRGCCAGFRACCRRRPGVPDAWLHAARPGRLPLRLD